MVVALVVRAETGCVVENVVEKGRNAWWCGGTVLVGDSCGGETVWLCGWLVVKVGGARLNCGW